MNKMKTLKLVSNILYGIAIVLLLMNIYQKSSGAENESLDMAAWMSLLVAGVFGIYYGLQKKKQKEQN